MIDIEYLEQKKSEIVAEHIRLCGLTELTEAEKIVISELDYQIKCLKEEQNEMDTIQRKSA
ncbi:MAG: hypothetical protein IKO38_07225 [Erysipelotrichaceae bacterium]|nr:hypothetical protein [Erysipelotrichaceae bacterium]